MYLLTLKVTVAIKVNAIAFLKSTLNKLWNGDCSKWNNFLVPLLHVHGEWLVWSISEVMTPHFSRHLPPRKVLLLWQCVIDSSKKISKHRVIVGAGGSPQAPSSSSDKPNINKRGGKWWEGPGATPDEEKPQRRAMTHISTQPLQGKQWLQIMSWSFN